MNCLMTAWDKHEKELRAWLNSRMGNSADAEDMLQNLFLKAMRQGARFCEVDNARAWLFRTARNALVDRLRRSVGIRHGLQYGGCRLPDQRHTAAYRRYQTMKRIHLTYSGLLLMLLATGPVQAARPAADDPHYKYQPNSYCGACHQEQLQDYRQSMMGKTPHDKVFQQFYFATNAAGKFDGFGYKGFHPDEPGDCANCHTPDKVLDAGQEVELKDAIEQGSKGISCDFCHTVSDVKVIHDLQTGRYDTDITRTVTRARGNTKFGPLADARSPAHATRLSPIHTKSEFCAMCHLNQEHLLSLSTYADWKKSYDAGEVTKQCQDCHMPTGGKDRPIAVGGKVRDGSTIHRHLFHGGHDPAMVKKAARLDLDVQRSGSEVVIEAHVTNVGAGHPLPGGATLRNIILLIDVRDSQDRPLVHTGSKQELLPPLAGRGQSPRDYAGQPGKMFARPFVTKKGMVPAGGFNADHVLFDTRIWPGKTALSSYHFRAQGQEPVRIKATLLYRWTFKPLADKKGWKLQDIVMASKELTK